MKTLKIYFKPVSYLLTFLILLQGCTVYKIQSSLDEAVVTKDKVKLVTKQNETQKYLYITTFNDEFYGVKMVNNQLTKTPVQKENIEIIRTKDKGTSTLLSLLVVGAGGFALLYIVALNTWNNAFDSL